MDDDAVPGLWPGDLPDEMRVSRLICTTLDPVLVPHGFAPGQGGASPGSASVVFCASTQHVRSRFPALVEPHEPVTDSECTDLNVYARTGPPARLGDVTLEGSDLTAALRRVGRPDLAERAARLTTLPIDDGVAELAELVSALLDTAQDGSARQS